MPSLKPNFICRGCKLATQMTRRPTRSSGLYAFLMPGEDRLPHVAAEAEREFEQFPRLGNFFGGEDAGHSQIDFGTATAKIDLRTSPHPPRAEEVPEPQKTA